MIIVFFRRNNFLNALKFVELQDKPQMTALGKLICIHSQEPFFRLSTPGLDLKNVSLSRMFKLLLSLTFTLGKKCYLKRTVSASYTLGAFFFFQFYSKRGLEISLKKRF